MGCALFQAVMVAAIERHYAPAAHPETGTLASAPPSAILKHASTLPQIFEVMFEIPKILPHFSVADLKIKIANLKALVPLVYLQF